MRKFFFFKTISSIVFLALLFACEKTVEVPKPAPAPIDQLPALTEQGLNTFGCLVDGEAFVARVDWNIGGAIEVWAGFNEETRLFRTQGTMETVASNFEDVRFKIYITDGIGMYPMTSVGAAYDGFNGYGGMCSFYHDTSNYGTVNISYLNEETNIVSGTFEMTLINNDCESATSLNITDGRFDLRY